MLEIGLSVKAWILENPIITIISFLIVIWIVGVRIYAEGKIEYGEMRIKSTLENIRNLTDFKTVNGLTESYHFAVLSSEVYGEVGEDGEFHRQWDKQNSSTKDVYKMWKLLNFETPLPEKPLDKTGSQVGLDSKLESGLFYRNLTDSSVQVALVFRGTDDLKDFWSNLYWITRFWPFGWNQYDLARTLGPVVEEQVKEKFKGKHVEIITAGHSLGGGLAHVAAYASESIKCVYAFDTSSVTGFYGVDKRIRDASKIGMRIYRIHEKGEILAYLRSFMSFIYPVVKKDPQIIDTAVNFDNGLAISQHSIENLANALVDNQYSRQISR